MYPAVPGQEWLWALCGECLSSSACTPLEIRVAFLGWPPPESANRQLKLRDLMSWWLRE